MPSQLPANLADAVASDDDVAQETPLKFYIFPVTVQPVDQTGVIGGQVSFTAAFSIPGGTAVTYRWQFKKILFLQTQEKFDPSQNAANHPTPDVWNDLDEAGGLYEGVATTTLTVKAIDSFLANDVAGPEFRSLFRLRVVRDAVPDIPSFTVPAALIVENYFAWNPQPFFIVKTFGAPNPPGSSWRVAPELVNTSLVGPLTYKWDFVSGSADIAPDDDTSPTPNFVFAGQPGDGVVLAVWTLTVTDAALTSVISDAWNIVVFAGPTNSVNVDDLAVLPTESGNPQPLIALDAANAQGAGLSFGAWIPIVQVNTRWPFANAVTILSPSSQRAVFSGPIPNHQPAGSFISAIFGWTGTQDATGFDFLDTGFVISSEPPVGAGFTRGAGTYYYLGLVDPFAP